jgi:hypothetical protein
MTKLGYLNSFPKEVLEREEERNGALFSTCALPTQKLNQGRSPQRIKYRKTNTASQLGGRQFKARATRV